MAIPHLEAIQGPKATSHFISMQRHSYPARDSKGFRIRVPRIRDKDQIYIASYATRNTSLLKQGVCQINEHRN